MINGKTISLSEIMWRILKNPLLEGITYEQAAELTLEFIKLIGAPLSFIDDVKTLEVVDHKVQIPKNTITVNGIKYIGEDIKDNKCIALRYATDVYHNALGEDNNCSEFTYVLQNCTITTSFKKGFIDISYKAIATDKDDFPMVPDNESFKMGLEYYILNRFVEPLWLMGKITDKVFEYIQQQRYFYSGQADSALRVQGVDHWESVMNGINRLIVPTTAHENFFKRYGSKEKIRKYN